MEDQTLYKPYGHSVLKFYILAVECTNGTRFAILVLNFEIQLE